MDKMDPLAQLKDIHLPEPVGFWPLAWGWYLVFALAMLCCFFLLRFTYQCYRHALAKKRALWLLNQYQKCYEQDKNAPLMSAQISELLRRVALAYYPRAQVASLNGEAWLDFLNQTGKNIDFTPVAPLLLQVPFKIKDDQDLHPLFAKAKLWIKQRGKPCLN